MQYVDVYIAAVPIENKAAYIALGEASAQIFKDVGALMCVDAWEDDVPEGELTSFSMAVQRKDGEAIATGYVVWPDKETRDKGMLAMREDPRMTDPSFTPPFDGKRLIFGGFQKIVDL
ncbi:DUF1428 domain-containing protein [Maricaulis sp.]|uniref:DUF1428 domain-containing protein n=1 Tax=Maricaulis sp. TaxID=1486257 RepID=UPI00262D5912|nr:DUF1428 domain-containing protein [Maricaulis sp.]